MRGGRGDAGSGEVAPLMTDATWSIVALPLSHPAPPGTLPRRGGRGKPAPLPIPGQPLRRGGSDPQRAVGFGFVKASA